VTFLVETTSYAEMNEADKTSVETRVSEIRTNEISRMAARKVRIGDIENGKYIFGNAEQKKAGYVITPFGQRVSRINIVATVIDKFLNEEETYCTLTLDDGTGVLKLKAFKEDAKNLGKFELGDIVLAVGKLRQYNDEVYAAAEAVRKLNNFNFEQMRRLETLYELLPAKRMIDELRPLHKNGSLEELKDFAAKRFGLDEEQLGVVLESLNVRKEIDYKPQILEIISRLDNGNGVEMIKLFEQSGLPENVVESALNDLLADAVIYEPLPGILKKV